MHRRGMSSIIQKLLSSSTTTSTTAPTSSSTSTTSSTTTAAAAISSSSSLSGTFASYSNAIKLKSSSSTTTSTTSLIKKIPINSKNLLWEEQQTKFSYFYEFNILTFNLLAPVYKRLSLKDPLTGRRLRESGNQELWEERLKKLLNFFHDEIYKKNIEIIALQEYWLNDLYTKKFEKELLKYSYEIKLLQRTGTKLDAVALLIKTTTFKILNIENIFLCSLGDRVAILINCLHIKSQMNYLIANTHLSFPHSTFDKMNQLQQIKNLTSCIDVYKERYQIYNATCIIVGDFNVEINSLVCNHLKNVGYFSTIEISPPKNAEIISLPNEKPFKPEQMIMETIFDHEMIDFFNKKNKKPIDDIINNNDDDDEAKEAMMEAIYVIKDDSVPVLDPINDVDVRYVSHRNHNYEDQGVDHIFIRPGIHETITTIQTTISSIKQQRQQQQQQQLQQQQQSQQQQQQQQQQYEDNEIKDENILNNDIKCDGRPPLAIRNSSSSKYDTVNDVLLPSTPVPLRKSSSRSGRALSIDSDSGADWFHFNNNNISNIERRERCATSDQVATSSIGIVDASVDGIARRQQLQHQHDELYSSSDDIQRRCLFVAETAVLPSNMPCKVWEDDFKISDHRPVTSKLVVGLQKHHEQQEHQQLEQQHHHEQQHRQQEEDVVEKKS